VANAWSEGTWDELGFGGIETATVTLTGFEVSGSVGTTSAATVNNYFVSGVSATGELGEETPLGNTVWGGGTFGADGIGWGGILSQNIEASGLDATGSTGNATVIAKASTVTTGNSAAGEIGSVVGRAAANAEVFSVTGSGALGEEEIDAKATVVTTGVESTASSGTAAGRAGAKATPSGVSATGELGEEVAPDYQTWGGASWGGTFLGWGGILSQNIEVTGLEATGEIGVDHVQIGGAIVRPTGVSANAEIGTEVARAAANATVTGLSASGALGEEEVDAAANVSVTGIEATASLGSVSVQTANNFQVSSLTARGYLGAEDADAGANAYVIGVSGTGRIARPLVWGEIDTAQNPSWVQIAA